MSKFKNSMLIATLGVCCFLAAGCTSSGDVAGGTNEVADENRKFVLNVIINPEFMLYLSSELKITEVFCMNEDAKKLFTDLDVTNMIYEEGLGQILSFKDENNLELAVEVSQPEEQKVYEADMTQDGEVIGTIIAYFDENDKNVKQVCLWDDGSMWIEYEREYSSKGKLAKQYNRIYLYIYRVLIYFIFIRF